MVQDKRRVIFGILNKDQQSQLCSFSLTVSQNTLASFQFVFLPHSPLCSLSHTHRTTAPFHEPVFETGIFLPVQQLDFVPSVHPPLSIEAGENYIVTQPESLLMEVTRDIYGGHWRDCVVHVSVSCALCSQCILWRSSNVPASFI